VFVQSTGSIVVLAVAQNALAYVVFGAVAFSLLMSLLFLLTRGSAGSAYDQIGRGGISREGDYGGGYGSGPPGPAPDSAAGRAEREQEIRQMLSARSERLVRRGEPALDVDAELARLLAHEQAPTARDSGLVAEVRQLVVARNERRIRRGLEPLDVDAEVARTLDELGA
jgi:hypothetical protein